MPRHVVWLVGLSVVMLVAAVGVTVFSLRGDEAFPWGIHIVTVPAVLLLGVIVGWAMRDRQLAEEAARKELEDGK